MTRRLTTEASPFIARAASTHSQARSVQPGVVADALAAPGRPLDAATRAVMEPRFGHDFSQVRVHTDSLAADSARSVNARAYTSGRDVGVRRRAVRSAFVAGPAAHRPRADARRPAERGRPARRAHGQHERAIDSSGKRTQPSRRVVAGGSAHVSPASGAPAIQREPPASDDAKKPEEKDAGDVIVEGLKTVAEQAVDNNPKVKTVVVEPIKNRRRVSGTSSRPAKRSASSAGAPGRSGSPAARCSPTRAAGRRSKASTSRRR